MGTCPLDHSVQDVLKKLEEQTPYLPEKLVVSLRAFLDEPLSQETLNETFHLLKKYDLAGADEQQKRNSKLKALLENRPTSDGIA